jgi:CheY-like chemotaxis protein
VVLVIDDDRQVASVVRRALAAEHDVVVETDGRAARDRLIGGETFDLILCDLSMPELSGIDLYEAVLAARPEVASRMVFLTGGAIGERTRAFLAETTIAIVEKPFTLGDLRRFVRTCGSRE